MESNNYSEYSKEQLIDKIKKLEEKLKIKEFKNKKIEKKIIKHEKKKNNVPYEYMKKALKVFYYGLNYQGFAKQSHVDNTIEEFLFSALNKTLLIDNIDKSDYSRAGRTDKGVSAFGNIVALKLRINEKNDLNYIRMINANLPEDIRIIGYADVSNNFNARYDCVYREYHYFFLKNCLNIEKMQEASKKFLGEHDFRNFCKINPTNTIDYKRTILDIRLEKLEHLSSLKSIDPKMEVYYYVIRGNSFVWHQIRCMMEILFLIGKGLESIDIIDELFDIVKNDARPSYNFAEDHPLVLANCHYDKIEFKESLDCNIDNYDHFKELSMKKIIDFTIHANMMKYFINIAFSTYKLNLIDSNFNFVHKSIQKQDENNKKRSYKKIMERPKSNPLSISIQNLKGKDKEIYEKKLQKKIKFDSKS